MATLPPTAVAQQYDREPFQLSGETRNYFYRFEYGRSGWHDRNGNFIGSKEGQQASRGSDSSTYPRRGAPTPDKINIYSLNCIEHFRTWRDPGSNTCQPVSSVACAWEVGGRVVNRRGIDNQHCQCRWDLPEWHSADGTAGWLPRTSHELPTIYWWIWYQMPDQPEALRIASARGDACVGA